MRFALILLLFVVCGSSAKAAGPCDAFDLAVALTPVPPQVGWALRRHFTLAQSLPAEADAVAIGDSLVEGWPPELMDALFGRRTFNFGVGNDRVQTVLWRMGASDLSGLRPEDTLILIGTNNLSAGDPACAIVAGVVAITARVRTLWPSTRIHVLGLLPRNLTDPVVVARTAEVNTGLRAALDGKDAAVDLTIVEPDFACSGRLPCDRFNADGLHLMRPGYAALVDLLKPRLAPR